MAYKDTTKVPQRIILWFTGPGYVTFKIGGHASVTQGTICKFFSTLCPQGATRATQCTLGAPNAPKSLGRLLFPKATSKWLFALSPGPQEQAREYFPVFPRLVSAQDP